MIGRLCGKLVAEELDGHVIVDVGGVGYEVLLPLGTAGRVRAAGEAVVLHIHTHVREEALDLYGFASALEREVFRLLIGVPNVGPKTALSVLSELPPPDLVRAVSQGDVARLNKISGIGKKTAERLVLELKEKLPRVAEVELPSAAQSPSSSNRERLYGALTNMGYRPAEAERAVDSLGDSLADTPLASALKSALAFLAR
ncbi:MAG: Holliday junction branch migration protein RuvA [Polyangiaceae bacterium]|nr:Holliday junction branch migration protein RuvA [Myxococcales bacterium]MCB9589539.1 Holliday junction branch migration protein RuvA [Polyangiaceae bacterium]MCB9609167.1 Holliday junction branch migration protein RuvA [Polyangiaceae bacterium]